VVYQKLVLLTFLLRSLKPLDLIICDLGQAEPIPEAHNGIRKFWRQAVSLLGDQVTRSGEDPLTTTIVSLNLNLKVSRHFAAGEPER
jgi:hypothetical protein